MNSLPVDITGHDAIRPPLARADDAVASTTQCIALPSNAQPKNRSPGSADRSWRSSASTSTAGSTHRHTQGHQSQHKETEVATVRGIVRTLSTELTGCRG